MLILYGALVQYDPLGTPAPVNTSIEKFHSADSLAHVEKTYPRKSISVLHAVSIYLW